MQEFIVNKIELQEHLTKLTQITKASSEISKCLLIVVKEDELVFSTTNEDIICYVKTDINRKKGSDGHIIIPAKKFLALIKKLPTKEEIITISFEGNVERKLRVKTSKGIYNFDEIKEKFPVPDTKNFDWQLKINGKTFYELIDRAGWAYADKDEDHPEIEGVYLKLNNLIEIMSTDMRKFAYASMETDFPGNENLIIPNKLIKMLTLELGKYYREMIKIETKAVTNRLKNKPSIDIEEFKMPDLHIKFTSNKINFQLEDYNYLADLIKSKEEFPESISGKKNFDGFKATIDCKRLKETLERVIDFSDTVRSMLIFEMKKGTDINVRSFNISTDTYSEEIIEHIWKYKDLELGFRGQALIDVLKHIRTDNVDLYFSKEESKDKQIPITVTEEQNINDYYLIQTLRID